MVTAVADELYLVCRVGDGRYALPISAVLELETYDGATPVPGALPWVAGLAQVRQRVVPAIDLRIRFGMPPAAPTLDTRIVVVQHGSRIVGLIVDGARDVTPLTAGSRLLPLDVATVLVQELRHGGQGHEEPR